MCAAHMRQFQAVVLPISFTKVYVYLGKYAQWLIL